MVSNRQRHIATWLPFSYVLVIATCCRFNIAIVISCRSEKDMDSLMGTWFVWTLPLSSQVITLAEICFIPSVCNCLLFFLFWNPLLNLLDIFIIMDGIEIRSLGPIEPPPNFTLNSDKYLNGTKLLKRGFSARLSRHPFFSSTLQRARVKTRHSINNSGGIRTSFNGSSEIPTKRGMSHFFNKLLQQMSALTTNQTNLRKRHESLDGKENQLGSHSNNLNEATNKNFRKCSTLPARLDFTPGVIGLRNHGNTCFINAILQCLNHTDLLAEYFVTDQYQTDLTRRSRLNARKSGTKGEITEQLAGLLKALWSSQYEPEMTFKLKSVIDKYGIQYRGAAQHDAQEFLLWLLDKVHEDLNTATKKKYKKVKVNITYPTNVWRIS